MVERDGQADQASCGVEDVTLPLGATDPAFGSQDSGRLFGDRLKTARQARGLSQAGLSTETGVTAAYISSIERGAANPTLETLLKLSDAVELEVWRMIAPDLVTRNAVSRPARAADKS